MSQTHSQDRLDNLDVSTCRQLLGSHGIGRLAFNAGPSPEILPVNYALHEDSIVFRTGAGAKQNAAVQGQAATFEVDGIHADRHSAWSVMVHGRLAVVDVDSLEGSPEPLPGGERSTLVRLQIDRMSGRRIPPDQDWVMPGRVWYGPDASDLMG
ncbi:pyridoxamine 5'-phosphate oxidase family protein [Salinisphaera sp. LB1]|uniref:pyridoxamine 5'-phosphate oxidase family protein n=1 Tax=Salinisphaera sp. LB1 TaxID=2183911 RepID=UPI000D708BDD|nr:pyridoxamine 5'-phosphate oxidase family protein [Salinisphaera sp. LB1]AWN17911.1 DNA-binding protein [Salinisphaera sp. LB1]